jgi:putative transposase
MRFLERLQSGSNKAALDYFNTDVLKEEEIEIRQIKYLNNIAEQDHRFVKKRTGFVACVE